MRQFFFYCLSWREHITKRSRGSRLLLTAALAGRFLDHRYAVIPGPLGGVEFIWFFVFHQFLGHIWRPFKLSRHVATFQSKSNLAILCIYSIRSYGVGLLPVRWGWSGTSTGCPNDAGKTPWCPPPLVRFPVCPHRPDRRCFSLLRLFIDACWYAGKKTI